MSPLKELITELLFFLDVIRLRINISNQYAKLAKTKCPQNAIPTAFATERFNTIYVYGQTKRSGADLFLSWHGNLFTKNLFQILVISSLASLFLKIASRDSTIAEFLICSGLILFVLSNAFFTSRTYYNTVLVPVMEAQAKEIMGRLSPNDIDAMYAKQQKANEK